MHYIVLGGGISPEKEISRRSATALQQGPQANGHVVDYLDPEHTPLPEIIRQGSPI